MHMFMPVDGLSTKPLSALQRENYFQIIFDCMNRNCLFHFTANLWQMFWKDLRTPNVEPYTLPPHNMTVYYVYTAMIHSDIILISFRTVRNNLLFLSIYLWVMFRSTFIDISKVIGHSRHFVTSVYIIKIFIIFFAKNKMLYFSIVNIFDFLLHM